MLLLSVAIGLPALPQGKGKGGGSPPPPPDPAIAFVGQSGNRYYLQVMNSDGTNVRTVLQLASGSGWNIKPAMSPDGSQVAFTATVNTVAGIYVVRVDGTGLRCVTPTHEDPWGSRPAWSPVPAPDGLDKIAFTDTTNAQGSGPHAIFVVSVDGSGLQQLSSPPPGGDGQPSWSRDSTRLAFTRAGGLLIVATLGVVGPELAITQETDLAAAVGSPLQDHHGLSPFVAWGNVSDVVAVSAMTFDSGGNFALWIVDPQSPSQPRRLFNAPSGNQVLATFGLNDERVYFGNGIVEACNFDGSDRTTIKGNARAPNHRRY